MTTKLVKVKQLGPFNYEIFNDNNALNSSNLEQTYANYILVNYRDKEFLAKTSFNNCLNDCVWHIILFDWKEERKIFVKLSVDISLDYNLYEAVAIVYKKCLFN